MSTTLFDKVWDSHVVRKITDGPDVLFIDRHLIHEVTSPVAFLGLEARGNEVLYPNKPLRVYSSVGRRNVFQPELKNTSHRSLKIHHPI